MAMWDFLGGLISSGLFDGRLGSKEEFVKDIKDPAYRKEMSGFFRKILLIIIVILGFTVAAAFLVT